jgi:hypothetical protein
VWQVWPMWYHIVYEVVYEERKSNSA